MAKLETKPTIQDFQRFVHELEEEKGELRDTQMRKCIRMKEDVIELLQAIRGRDIVYSPKRMSLGDVEMELVHILISLCAIANRYHIDLEKAFRLNLRMNVAGYLQPALQACGRRVQ